jgi:hypothetical protein
LSLVVFSLVLREKIGSFMIDRLEKSVEDAEELRYLCFLEIVSLIIDTRK